MARQYWQLVGQPERRRFLVVRKRVPRRHPRRGEPGRHPAVPANRSPGSGTSDVSARRRRGRARCSGTKRRSARWPAAIIEPLIQGAAGMRPVAGGHVAHPARVVRPARRAAHRRRGDDRVRPHGHDVRLRTGRRAAGFSVSGEGAHRRVSAAGGDLDDRARCTRRFWVNTASARRFSTVTATPGTRWAARRRGESGDLPRRGRADAGAGEDRTIRGSAGNAAGAVAARRGNPAVRVHRGHRTDGRPRREGQPFPVGSADRRAGVRGGAGARIADATHPATRWCSCRRIARPTTN